MEQYEQRPKGEKVWGTFTKHEVTQLSWCVNGMTGGKAGEVKLTNPFHTLGKEQGMQQWVKQVQLLLPSTSSLLERQTIKLPQK